MGVGCPVKGFLHYEKSIFNMSLFKVSPYHVTLYFYPKFSSVPHTSILV